MATKFSEIYCLNSVIKNDPKIAKLPDYLYNSICFKYLKLGIGYCKTIVSIESNNYIQNINIEQEPVELEYDFVGDGVQTEFLLDLVPPLQCKFYVGFKSLQDDIYTEIKDFEFDENTNVLTTVAIAEENQEVLIVAYTDGEFVSELDYSLQTILAEAMNIPFLEQNQNNRNLLNLIVHSNAWRLFSQNDHLRGVNYVLKDQKNYVRRLLIDYSFANTGERMIGLVGMTRQ